MSPFEVRRTMHHPYAKSLFTKLITCEA
jgi:hypothetical protein